MPRACWEAGLSILEDLARLPVPYVPALHMAARHLVKRGRIGEARQALREGIEAARAQGETHAAGEMAELLQSLGGGGAGDFRGTRPRAEAGPIRGRGSR